MVSSLVLKQSMHLCADSSTAPKQGDQWQLTGDCDGCGIAFYKDEELGEVCIDTSGLLAWEEQPW